MAGVNMTLHAENMREAGLYTRTEERTSSLENEVNETFTVEKLNAILQQSNETAQPPNIFDDLLSTELSR
jgi:hypothetical protein